MLHSALKSGNILMSSAAGRRLELRIVLPLIGERAVEEMFSLLSSSFEEGSELICQREYSQVDKREPSECHNESHETVLCGRLGLFAETTHGHEARRSMVLEQRL